MTSPTTVALGATKEAGAVDGTLPLWATLRVDGNTASANERDRQKQKVERKKSARKKIDGKKVGNNKGGRKLGGRGW